jgi:hypothetical protein
MERPPYKRAQISSKSLLRLRLNAATTASEVPSSGWRSCFRAGGSRRPIKKADLTPIRADTDIFVTGKIIDQIWTGLKRAKVLVAELTGRNPNVLYGLGLAHALHKPVVLISSNEADVPFDVRHLRVIYYELTDPFWGEKLIAKVAENVVSAIKNPNEAIQFRRNRNEELSFRRCVH